MQAVRTRFVATTRPLRTFLLMFLPMLLLIFPDPVAGSRVQARETLDQCLHKYQRESGPRGTVYYYQLTSPEHRKRRSVRIAEAMEQVEKRLERSRDRPFTAIFAPNRREFERMYQAVTRLRPQRWIAGVAFPAKDLLLVRGETFPSLMIPGDRPEAVLQHELAHLVIHRRLETRVPRWLDEGLAMWASKQFLSASDEAHLSGLARMGTLYSLEHLGDEIPSNHNLATVAYRQSLLLVEWLSMRFGPKTANDLLDALESGTPLETALKSRTGMGQDELDREFRHWLVARRSLWEVVPQFLNFWTVASFLALIAIARSVIRKRRRMRQMEEEERESEQEEDDYL